MSSVLEKFDLSYQNRAVVKIIKILRNKDRVVLQAPTGSGKTFIIANVIQKMLFDENYVSYEMAFLFLAPSAGRLIHQCYRKISDYLLEDWVRGFETCYIGRDETNEQNFYLGDIDYFQPKKVYFLGWGNLSKNSLAVRKNSWQNNLFKIAQATKRRGIKLVVIIDEVHREYRGSNIKSETKKEFFVSIKDLTLRTIEMSATITFNEDPEAFYQITRQEVIKDKAIKKFVHVNLFSVWANEDRYDSENDIDFLIKQGLKKQKEVKVAYKKVNIKRIPIMLVQIPDETKKIAGFNIEQHYRKALKKIFQKYEQKYDFKHAFWLDDEKTVENKDELLREDSKYVVIIFKQAIATGWDVPRANILVRLRNPLHGSEVFEIQTLGRILRNPFKKYYFENSKLKEERQIGMLINNGFVFTKDQNYKNRIQNEDFIITTEENISPLVEEMQNDDEFYLLLEEYLLIEWWEENELYLLIHEIEEMQNKSKSDYSFKNIQNDNKLDHHLKFATLAPRPKEMGNNKEMDQTWEVYDEKEFDQLLKEMQYNDELHSPSGKKLRKKLARRHSALQILYIYLFSLFSIVFTTVVCLVIFASTNVF